MKAILVTELRGLTQQAEMLAQELDHMGVNDEHVRAATIEVLRAAGARAAASMDVPEAVGEQGADTFYWTFDTVDKAVRFGARLLADLWQKAQEQGLYYVKPSVAVGWCEPKFANGRFIDTGSIEVYRVADAGRAFMLYAVDAAIAETAGPFSGAEADARKSTARICPVAWDKVLAGEAADDTPISLPTLLLDSDVVYSDSVGSAIGTIRREQAASKEALVFGGPPSFKDPLFVDYVRDCVDLIRNDAGCRFAIVSYLPVNDPVTSLTWLEACYRLAAERPRNLRFSAFLIGEGQLRPFSFQVFDKARVHVGLRGYSPFRQTPTLTSAFLLRNAQIARLFANDFDQSFQSVGQVDTDKHADLTRGLGPMDEASRQQVETTVRALLA